MDSMTYLDFAENDYKYFMHSYESGYVAIIWLRMHRILPRSI